jgi:hypothetical protein
MRLRTLLRFAMAAPVEAGLRVLIPEAEQQLAAEQERTGPMWIAFCAARSRAISPYSFRQSSRWS